MKKLKIIFILIIFLVQFFPFVVYADDNLEIDSDACILIEPNSGVVVYEKNSDQKLYPASTTKIMTAILVIENCKLTDTVTVSENAINSIPSGYVKRRHLCR